jgi:short-subunit dehydrogenase
LFVLLHPTLSKRLLLDFRTQKTSLGSLVLPFQAVADSGNFTVNNAGIGSGATILGGSEDFIRKTFEVNTMAHFWMVREFLPAMIQKNHGHVVTIASMASFIIHAGNVDYSCTKASALAFHEGLAVELRSRYKAPNVRTT